jgi:hypothetical protein
MEKKPLRRFRLTRKRRSKLLASGLPDVLEVECGELQAQLYVSKMGSGTRGPCIEWNGMWLTPCQLEEISNVDGVGSWKRTIQYNGLPLNSYIKLGLIKLHKRYCNCDKCTSPLLEIGVRRSSKVLGNVSIREY